MTGTREESKAQSASSLGAISVSGSSQELAGVVFVGTSAGGASSGGKNKENTIMLSSGAARQEQLPMAQNWVAPAAAGGEGARSASGTAVAMSGFFLVRNVREDDAGGDGADDGGGYQLPLRETVVGRDSVRDKAKVNSNKLRLGIPSSMEVRVGFVEVLPAGGVEKLNFLAVALRRVELMLVHSLMLSLYVPSCTMALLQFTTIHRTVLCAFPESNCAPPSPFTAKQGISRDQATLKVMLSSNRVLVTNKKTALNPIRIQRWSGSAAIALSEAQRRGPNGGEALAKAMTLTLTAGQQGYLYPGDSLELDGWVQRGKSKYGYVLHPLSKGTRRVAPGTPTTIGRRAGRMSPALTGRRTPSLMKVLNTPPSERVAVEAAMAGNRVRRSPTPPASGSTPSVSQAASSLIASGVESGVVSSGCRSKRPQLFPTTATRSSSGLGPEVLGKALAQITSSLGTAGAKPPAGSPGELTSSPPFSSAGRIVEGGGLSASVDDGSWGPALGEDVETIKKRRAKSIGGSLGHSALSATSPEIPVTSVTVASPPSLLTSGGGSSDDVRTEDGIDNQNIGTPRKRACLANASSGPVPRLTSHEASGAIDDQGVVSTYCATSKPGKNGGASPVPGDVSIGVVDAALTAVAQIVPAAGGGGGESADLSPKQAKTDITTRPTMAFVVVVSPSPSRAVVTMPETEADHVIASATVAAVGPAGASAVVSAGTPPQAPASGTSKEDAKSDEKQRATVTAGKAKSATWKEADTVVLRARCGKGMNKPGGVARVVSVFEDGDYSVKMVLGEVPWMILSPSLRQKRVSKLWCYAGGSGNYFIDMRGIVRAAVIQEIGNGTAIIAAGCDIHRCYESWSLVFCSFHNT